MKISIYLTLFSFGSWGLVAGFIPTAVFDIFWGMFGPWLVGLITLIIVKQAYDKDPESVTALMMKSFLGKMIFYGVYITLLILFAALQKVQFIISFTVYFIVLHIIEALYFQAIFKPKKS
ncbi:MAG: hypothetical protein HQ528_11710 [Candidatus Marinimicrobia bacterium]|nr:hypothetical protein [Candidatus Neomarinimicrobiota bacterium]